MSTRRASTRGFKRTSVLLQDRIRQASETRGFAQSRLLTHWEEIVGPDVAQIARPVNVSYGRGGFGATLTILTTGAQATMLQMQAEQLREKVNAVYGYNAISRIKITQTAPTGFSEGQVDFEHRAPKPQAEPPNPETVQSARNMASPVGDASLREALESLGQNILSKSKR